VPVLRRAPFAVILAIQLVIAMLLAEGLLLAMYHLSGGVVSGRVAALSHHRVFQPPRHRAARRAACALRLRAVLHAAAGRLHVRERRVLDQFVVNTIGVRDNQRSLTQPEIVVAGDSYAMGWGVQQDESFPELIERRTGRRVLNAAVSSYGTVREGACSTASI
jgi:hypothetical protein